MKILLTLSLLFYTVNGFSFFSIFSQNEEISSLAASCTGVADGTRLPDETNCQKFTLCDGGFGLSLSCRSSDPYFYRCNSTCVNDMSVCQIKDCPGATTTTGATTTSATTTSATTTATDTTASATTTSATTTVTTTPTTTVTTTATTTTVGTTTRFNPPTVPIKCDPECSCVKEDSSRNTACDPPNCECDKQYTCMNGKCGCDKTIECPMILADCILPTNCGCTERCNCIEPDVCFCVTNGTQCPFDDVAGECVQNCGCQKNCDCKTTATTGCTCKDTCACIEPPKVCPFKPAECVDSCGCQERCICNGDSCRCDGENACPKSF